MKLYFSPIYHTYRKIVTHFIHQISTLNAQWSTETDTSMIYVRHGICFHTKLIKMKLNRSTVPIPQECHCQKNINSFLRDEYRIVRIVRPYLRYMFPDQTGNACLQGELKGVPNSNGCHFAKYIYPFDFLIWNSLYWDLYFNSIYSQWSKF